MSLWTENELDKIGNADELQIASLRQNGTLRNPVTIWVVRVDDELYIRSVNGRSSVWFRGTQTSRSGQIKAGGVDKDVTFIDVSDTDIIDQIDNAYLTKYKRYPAQYVNPMLVPKAQAATIKLVPK